MFRLFLLVLVLVLMFVLSLVPLAVVFGCIIGRMGPPSPLVVFARPYLFVLGLA